ncbi:Spy/CpxP family protein refolding chaperone [Paraburkholderia susongensis]|uniref:Spy/CpxP family protein refolding chaperone n=1 Tax=Paraburkholderia susongensis TaxID=1515439 RepID=UPI000A1CA27B|nr:Spy/CpxP family protein refolding chaperone [Paraburkholderia susongensis]
MKNSVRKVFVPALLTFAFASASAWAQTPASSAAAKSPAARASSHAQKHQDAVEQRIDELHAELKITDQQSQQWDAFAQTMRDNAKAADQAFHERAQKLHSMSADDSMKSYAALAQLHAENMQKLSTAFSALYAALSDDQKQTADVLYRNEHPRGKPHHAPHKRAPAAAASAASAPSPASN